MNVATGPYFDDEGQPILRNSVIVAADILGYKQKIQWASQREEKLEPLLYNLYVAIKESFQSVGDTDRIRRFAKMMTDDVLVAYPLPTTDNGITVLLGACLDIARFQANMIGYGLAVRGGISVDKIHMSDLVVFPTERILAERCKANARGNPPRIVLSDSARSFLTVHCEKLSDQYEQGLRDWLWGDENDTLFINYLKPISNSCNEERKVRLSAHKQSIEYTLEEFSQCPRILEKYTWMGNYHNKFCRSVPEFNSAEYFVEL